MRAIVQRSAAKHDLIVTKRHAGQRRAQDRRAPRIPRPLPFRAALTGMRVTNGKLLAVFLTTRRLEDRQQMPGVRVPVLDRTGEHLPDPVDHHEIEAGLRNTAPAFIGTAAEPFKIVPDASRVATDDQRPTLVGARDGWKAGTIQTGVETFLVGQDQATVSLNGVASVPLDVVCPRTAHCVADRASSSIQSPMAAPPVVVPFSVIVSSVAPAV